MVSPNDSRTSLGRKDKEFCEGTKQERPTSRTLHVSLDKAEAVIDEMTVVGVGDAWHELARCGLRRTPPPVFVEADQVMDSLGEGDDGVGAHWLTTLVKEFFGP